MFSFFKKKKPLPEAHDLSVLKCDMHSHLIPGIDDGSPDVDTSITLIEGLKKLGYKKIITTPHLMADLYPNSRTTILNGFDKLVKALQKRKIDIPVRAAAEYFLDDHFDSLLEKDEPLLTIKDNLVLVEFSFASIPIDYKQKLFNMQMKGYKPILAHPERYAYLHKKFELYEELRDFGCLFQVNLLSLIGYYGKNIEAAAEKLYKLKYIELLGTDLHHERHMENLNVHLLHQKVKDIADNLPLLNDSL
ncbi:MAG: histidinol phosphatase [Chitinophagaceae bacterium]|nr:histidinol phosphatase [Chitinophagaceae bacterium]MCW5926342.1 histidinol phosphatase [Chitinophagaceae bacterium]